MTRLRLVCHAATSAVRSAAFPGDEAVEERVLAKLSLLRDQIRPGDETWTSPARRAVETAEGLGLSARTEPRLDECDYGRWAGRTLAEVQQQDPEGVAQWLSDPSSAPHGGETLEDLMARVGHWLDSRREASGLVVAVTHASVIRAAIVLAIEATPRSFWRIDVAPLSLTRLSGSAGRWTLSGIGPLLAKPR